MQILNEVGQLNLTMENFDYSDVSSGAAPNAGSLYTNNLLNQSIWAMVANKAQVDVQKSINGGVGGGCNGLNQIFFTNGAVLCYPDTTPNGDRSIVINAVIDTNGSKGPNQFFQCDNANCTSGKEAADQFNISLIGTNAYPGSTDVNGVITGNASKTNNAAVWAMKK